MQPQYIPSSPTAKDMTGQRFGRLLVLSCAGRNRKRGLLWHCLCDCGQETIVLGRRLRISHTTSCGCAGREHHVTGGQTKHGMSNTRIFRTWTGMINRCTNPRYANYQYYGGRGITVDPTWVASFEAFYRDMGEPPSPQHTIDRIDNDGNYEPGNCRWATKLTQGRNRRNVKQITYNNQTQTIVQWAKQLNFSYNTLYNRLFTMRWSVERAFTTPVRVWP